MNGFPTDYADRRARDFEYLGLPVPTRDTDARVSMDQLVMGWRPS